MLPELYTEFVSLPSYNKRRKACLVCLGARTQFTVAVNYYVKKKNKLMETFGKLLSSAMLFGGLLGSAALAADGAANEPTNGAKQEQSAKPAGPPPSMVGADAVRAEDMSQTLPIIGRLVAVEAGKIAAQTTGIVEQLPVQVGDEVAVGTVLAVLDQRLQKAQLALIKREIQAAEARKDSAVARAELARAELSRLEKLRGSAVFSESLYDQRRSELKAAQASSAEAEAQAALARVRNRMANTDFGYTTIKAIFPGVITEKHTNLGAWVAQGSPIVSMVNTKALELEADVPAGRMGVMQAGDLLSASVEGKPAFNATLRAILPEENVATRTRRVRLSLDEADKTNLVANQAATLRWPVGGKKNVLTVHKDAVLHMGGSAMVYVVEEGKANIKPIQLGEATASRFVVLSGLAAGDQVVIRGNERLRPGQAVMIKPEQ